MNTRPIATAVLRRVVVAALAALVAMGAPGGPVSASRQDANPPRWLLSLLTWLAAVNTHQPGKPDAAIGAAATTRLVDLEGVIANVLALRDRLSRDGQKPIEHLGHRFTPDEVRQLMGIRAGEPVAAAVNRLIHRGAVYHADVAIMASSTGTAEGAAQRPGRSVDVIGDGQRQRTTTSTVHWQFGRELIDRLSPSPSRDPVARTWYLATGASLQSQLLVSEADDHYSRARQIFPDDAQVLFRGACALETLTAPTLQAALGPDLILQRSPGSSRLVATRPSARSLLDRAEQSFRRALEKDAALTEARVRLARLTAAHGRHGEAIDMLRQAVAAAPPDDLRFLALMLLGDEQMAVGLRAEARAHYEEAADLYPTAQSPLLALALLARERGDRAAAVAAIDRLSRLPPEPEKRVDPSWGYYIMQGRDAGTLMQQLYELVLRETP
jgi:hypothetical protein